MRNGNGRELALSEDDLETVRREVRLSSRYRLFRVETEPEIGLLTKPEK